MAVGLTFVTMVLGLLFGASLLEQYLTRRQPHQLVWAAALFLITFAMGMWFLRETFGVNDWIFRLGYISGTMLVTAYLGTGVLYLLAPRQIAHGAMGALGLLTLIGFIVVMVVGIGTPDGCASGLKGLECLSPGQSITETGYIAQGISIFAILLNIYGVLAILGGLFWTLEELARRERPSRGGPGPWVPAAGTTPVLAALERAGSATVVWFQDLGSRVMAMWDTRDFWRRDDVVQRPFSFTILFLSIVLGALGGTLNVMNKSELYLGFFLLSLVLLYGAFLANREVVGVSPHVQLKESRDALVDEVSRLRART